MSTRQEGTVPTGTSRQGSARGPGAGLDPRLLVVIYAVVAMMPLLIALVQGHAGRNVWREFGSAVALVGFAALLMEFLLSGRFRSLSGRVGIDVTMRFHQLLALTALALIVLHPLLYAVPNLLSDPPAAATQLQRMFLSEGLRTGVIAWFLILALVPLALWRDRLPVRYEIWRASHGLGALAIALFSAHHTLRVGTYSSEPLLTVFWYGLAGIAVASLTFVYGVKPWLKRLRPFTVTSNEKVGERTWRVSLKPDDDERVRYRAGQFAWVNLGTSPFGLTEHPFSFSSAPGDDDLLQMTIKESGDFTNRVGAIKPGTPAYLDGPHGTFTLDNAADGPLVMVAGGVGFAPVFGLLRELAASGWPHPVTVIYGNRAASQILYSDELDRLAGRIDLTVHHVLSEPPEGWDGLVGEITPDILRQCLGRIDPHVTHFVCGPPGMIDVVDDVLTEAGVPSTRIVAERFRYS